MNKFDEEVLVIARDRVVTLLKPGITSEGIDSFEGLIRQYGVFKKRSEVEDNLEWKQVIPYLVFQFQDKFWLMQRTGQGTEGRLHNFFTLGIGGHIQEDDIQGRTIIDWANREFTEEVSYEGNFTSHPLGLINDDSIPVNQVHLGYVVLLEGDSEKIEIKEKNKLKGELVTIEKVENIKDQLESWSKIVFELLKSNPHSL